MDKKNLRRVTITVTAQTLHHMTNKAGATGRRALGQVVDELVRENRLATNNKNNRPNRAHTTDKERK